jgi:hypothetical protein
LNDLGADIVTNIDKQRVAAVRKLEALGYRYEGNEWVSPAQWARAISPLCISMFTRETFETG